MTLTFNAHDDFSAKKLSLILEASPYHAEEILNEFVFEVEDEDEANFIEGELSAIIDRKDINGHFELED